MNSDLPTNFGKVEAIDSSLNILKELESKLKHGKFHQEDPLAKEISFTHHRMKTDPNTQVYQSPLKNNPHTNAFTITEKSESASKAPYHHAYTTSQPTIVENNQNEYGSVKEIVKENRKLKKYVNCLLQMNDYLKNQLVRKDQTFGGANKMGHTFELELMKMEVEYLKELNRDKELEIRKNEQFGKSSSKKRSSNSKMKTKENFRTDFIKLEANMNRNNRGHYRSASVYEGEANRINFNPYDYNQNEFNSDRNNHSHRFVSNTSSKTQNEYKAPPKKMSHTSIKSSNKVTQKKKKSMKNPEKNVNKCRLCYI